MKRLLGLCLALLLLSGCAADVPEASTAETMGPGLSTQLYDPDSAVEAETKGALRAYPLGNVQCVGLAAAGEDILLFIRESGTRLIRMSAEDGTVAASVSLTDSISPTDGSVQITAQRVGYYEAATGSMVFLDGQLAEVRRETLPEEISGPVVLSPDMDTIYYCVDQEIHALDLQTGTPRLVKRHSAASQTMLQSCFDGKVLTCLVTEPDGDCFTCFLSAETGETLSKDATLWDLATYGDSYFLQRTDGIVNERLFGSGDGAVQSLNLTGDESIIPALAMGGVISTAFAEGKLELSFYDLDSGRRTAALTLSGVEKPQVSMADKTYLWFVAYDEASDQQILYRWDVAGSTVEDDTIYTGPRYTADAPDLAGLEACQALADEIGGQYGVDIQLAEAAVAQPCDYALEPEYQVKAFQESLESLAQALAQYPDGFLSTMCEPTDSGVLHIGLVRSISNHLTGVQYWSDGDAYIALAVGEKLEQIFYHELSHVLDTYVIANSLAYDNWEDWNPEDFSYDYSYDLYTERESQDYLEGENRAFIDSYAMTYPKEDRARILEYAMTAGHEDLFTAPILQTKLRQVCIGIREAFDWEKDPRVFPWEQYLEEPLAYTENS